MPGWQHLWYDAKLAQEEHQLFIAVMMFILYVLNQKRWMATYCEHSNAPAEYGLKERSSKAL